MKNGNVAGLEKQNYLCIDEADLWIQGHFGSDFGRILKVEVMRCSGSDKCASEQEIDQYFKNFPLLVAMN